MDVLQKAATAARSAERTLNRYHREWARDRGSKHQSFFALRLQSASIQFELCSQMVEVIQTPPGTFARKVALKDLIHKVFEYDQTLRRHHILRLSRLTEQRGMHDTADRLREICREWKGPLTALSRFTELRNKTSGHYDPDIAAHITQIEQLSEDVALDAVAAFMGFSLAINKTIQEVGRGPTAQ